MQLERILLVLFSLWFSICNASGILYEVKRGKKRIVSPTVRAVVYFVLCSQWFVAALFFAFGWENFLDEPENPGTIFGLLIYLLIGVPLALIWIEWALHRFRIYRSLNEDLDINKIKK